MSTMQKLHLIEEMQKKNQERDKAFRMDHEVAQLVREIKTATSWRKVKEASNKISTIINRAIMTGNTKKSTIELWQYAQYSAMGAKAYKLGRTADFDTCCEKVQAILDA